MKRVLFFGLAFLGVNLLSAQFEDVTEQKVASLSDSDLKQLVIDTAAPSNSNAKAFGVAVREYGVRTGAALKVGNVVYFKNALRVPEDAKLTKESEYTSGNANWRTFDFEDNSRYYSLTLNTVRWEIVSRFVTDK